MISAIESKQSRFTRSKAAQLQDLLRTELNTSLLRSEGRASGGCISDGSTYSIDTGKVFVKVNRDSQARIMFDGEVAGLVKIGDMDVIKVPKPIKVVDIPSGGAAFILENLEFVEYGKNGMTSSQAATLGKLVARLHLKNKEIAEQEKKGENCVQRDKTLRAVKEFGFDVTTYYGYVCQRNEWHPSWETFFARKVQEQIELLPKEEAGAVVELWAQVLRKLPQFFKGVDIVPALLHGDLWDGNVAMTADGFVTFDPASFYGHAEYDLAVSYNCCCFPQSFHDNYFKIIPKETGFKERLELYKLYHLINEWNHFGDVKNNKESALRTLTFLAKMN